MFIPPSFWFSNFLTPHRALEIIRSLNKAEIEKEVNDYPLLYKKPVLFEPPKKMFDPPEMLPSSNYCLIKKNDDI